MGAIYLTDEADKAVGFNNVWNKFDDFDIAFSNVVCQHNESMKLSVPRQVIQICLDKSSSKLTITPDGTALDRLKSYLAEREDEIRLAREKMKDLEDAIYECCKLIREGLELEDML